MNELEIAAADQRAVVVDRGGGLRSYTAAGRDLVDGDPVNGPIFADLPTGSYLSLGQVVRLHAQQPELFAWCR